MAEVGHEVAIYILAGSAGDTAPTDLADFTAGELDGIESSGFSSSRTQLDRTDFKNTEEVKKRFQGLKDGSVSLSGFLTYSTAQQMLWTAHDGDKDAIVWVNIVFSDSFARMVECTVESIDVNAEVDGRVDMSVALNFSGAPATGVTS